MDEANRGLQRDRGAEEDCCSTGGGACPEEEGVEETNRGLQQRIRELESANEDVRESLVRAEEHGRLIDTFFIHSTLELK